MTHRAGRPVRQRFMTPNSLVTRIIRVGMDPSPPAPALFIFDSRVSAGCEMIAATTPATVPEPRLMTVLKPVVHSCGLLPVDLYMASATLPCTANLAIVYGTCLKSIGPMPE